MALYHLSVKPISRSVGRSATAASAYRAGEKIVDERTGEIHDYTKKSGVQSTDIVLPDGAPEWATHRAQLWNAAELAEKRKDACVAREFEVALPAELSPEERRKLAFTFAKEMANLEGCAVDVAIHAPGKGGDNRNHHAHILRTTRKVEADGLGAKLDTEQAGRKRKDDLEQVRARWGELCNVALERAGHSVRVDHRTLEAQGIDRAPTVHLGPAATGYERRTGEPSDKTEREAGKQADRAKEAADLAQQIHQAERVISDLANGLAVGAQMVAEFEAEKARQQAAARPTGIDPRSRYHPDNIAKREAAKAAAEAAKPGPTPRELARQQEAKEQAEPVTPKATTEQQAKAQAVAVYRAKMQARVDAKRQPPPQPEAKKAPALVDLPIGEQVKVFDYSLEKFTAIRQEKLNRVAGKLLKRQERREKAVQAVLNKAMPKPTGLLAAFKQKAYKETMDALELVYQRARKLVEQAGALQQKVAAAAAHVRSWAYARLKRADPGLVARVESHRQVERMEVAQRQKAAREASRGKDRGHSR
ncbi:MAG: MobQ family relaxase [Rhodoferax sp.]|nr:MobQ family relaxase [Rhodoferax sp.]